MDIKNLSKLFRIRWIRVIGIPIFAFVAFIVWIVVINPMLFGEGESLMDVGSVRLVLQRDTETNIVDLGWSPNGTLLAFLDERNTISVINVETDKIESLFNIDEEEATAISSVAWDSTGNHLLIVSCRTEIWDYQNSQWNTAPQTVTGEDVAEGAVDWNPSQSLMATGWQDGSVLIWNVKNSSERLELPAHEDAVNDVSWSPDGSMLASVGGDGKLFVWEVSELQQLGE